MPRHVPSLLLSSVLASLGGGGVTAGTPDATARNDRQTVVRLDGSGARAIRYERDGRVRRLYGTAMARDASPEASAARFVADHAGLAGLEAADLRPRPPAPGGALAHPLLPDPATGVPRFFVLHSEQARDGVPVHGARLTMLVRNEPGYPVVLAAPDLRPLGAWRVPAAGPHPDGAAAACAHVTLRSTLTGAATATAAPQRIWAGTSDDPRPPVLADAWDVALDADAWFVLTDAASGRVLHAEPLVCTRTVSGAVAGRATEGAGAEQCAEEIATPLPFARIESLSSVTFAGPDGQFVLPGLFGGSVNLTASLAGTWFEVTPFAGPDAIVYATGTSGTPVEFLLNAANDDELVRAQVNAYVEANRVRAFALAASPAYPTLGDGGFPVNVNRTDGFCPGNAWYSPSEGGSINFCRAGANFTNTAFSAVVHHEFGHHLVHAGGSGQQAYGEGMSDVMALLMLDEPELAIGFLRADCAEGIRSAENDLRYPCFGEAHYCGQLLSACIWDIRIALASTHPETWRDVLGGLAVNSIMLHSGSSITPDISIDFLVLDDDNDTIFDGTPHADAITSGFDAHGMLAPALAAVTFAAPDGLPELIAPDGATVRITVDAAAETPEPGTGLLHYDDGSGLVAIPLAPVGASAYDAVFPGAPCRSALSYFVSVETSSGAVATWPDGAPTERFHAISAAGIVALLADDFETDGDWSVENIDLADGAWERGVPAGNGSRGDPTVDFDGSGACWLTDNGAAPSDVDGGPTRLRSPAYDLSGASDPVIRYARWFTNNDDDEDRLDVFVSDDDGATWALAESTANDPTGWSPGGFRVLDHVDLTDVVRVRFDVADAPNDSTTEAAVDAFEIVEFTCGAGACGADLDGGGTVGFADLSALLAAWGPCPGCAADLDADGTIGPGDLDALLDAWGACP